MFSHILKAVRTLVLVGVAIVATSASAQKYQLLAPPADPVPVAASKSINAAIVHPELFCTRLNEAVASNPVFQNQTTYTAPVVSATLVEALRSSKINEYFGLGENESAPNIMRYKGYLSVSKILKSTMGLKADPMILQDADELRLLPHMQFGTHIVVAASEASALSVERAVAVIAAAGKANIHVSVIWTGSALADLTNAKENVDAKTLAYIALMTDGKFISIADVAKQTACQIAKK